MSIVITWKTTDITAHVMYEDAMFVSSVGSQPGEFQLRVKDVDRNMDFHAGERITLDIDGLRYFDGYIWEARQSWAFPVVNSADTAENVRIWELRGPDVTSLFRRRFVFRQTDPKAGPLLLPAGTSDYAFIQSLITNYLSLSSDGLSYDIQHVGTPDPDSEGKIAVATSWETAMHQIANLPGAVWGIRPDRTFYYMDDSTITAPFALSDQPDNATTFGYSNYSWLNDGARIVNDARIWGVGLGWPKVVYDHVADADSIATHGLWQNSGSFRQDLYKPDHVHATVESIVYGSPQHLHGGKDDAVYVNCRVVKSGLLPGHKVQITNNVFGDTIVLPIKKLKVTFANKTQALYDLTMTWDIDSPLVFFDYPPTVMPKLPDIIDIWQWPPTCYDLSLDVPSMYFDWGPWVVEKSDPMLGTAIFDGGSIDLVNRKRYGQGDPVFVLGFPTQGMGDGYGDTSVWVSANRTLSVVGNYSIIINFSVYNTMSPGTHYSPFPKAALDSPFSGLGPFGMQSNLMRPEPTLQVSINGVTFTLLDTNGVGGSGGLGQRADGTPITFIYKSNGETTIADEFSTVTLQNSIPGGPPKPAFGDTLQIYAEMHGNANWDGTFALNGSGSFFFNDGASSYPATTHFFDNNFPLNPSGPFKGFYIDAGAGYSPGPEDGVSTAFALTMRLQLTPDFTIAPCTPDTQQVLAGTFLCEELVKVTDTQFQARHLFGMASTQVKIDGIEQRLNYDYVEIGGRTIQFRSAVPSDAVVVACYLVIA